MSTWTAVLKYQIFIIILLFIYLNRKKNKPDGRPDTKVWSVPNRLKREMVFIMAPERVLVAVTRLPAVTWTTSSLDACEVASVVVLLMDCVLVSLSSYDMSDDVNAEPADAAPLLDGVVINDVLNKWTRFKRWRNELLDPVFSPSSLRLLASTSWMSLRSPSHAMVFRLLDFFLLLFRLLTGRSAPPLVPPTVVPPSTYSKCWSERRNWVMRWKPDPVTSKRTTSAGNTWDAAALAFSSGDGNLF